VARKPETVFRSKVFTWLAIHLPGAWFESIQQIAIGGTPDILGCVRGRFVALEIKAEEKSPVSELQKLKLERIASAGGTALVVHPQNWTDVQKTLLGLRGY
jgi:hypothetical protein